MIAISVGCFSNCAVISKTALLRSVAKAVSPTFVPAILMIFTTSSFDSGAEQKAREAHHTIILIDGLKLVDLMHEYDVGVQVKQKYEVKEIDMDFFDGD